MIQTEEDTEKQEVKLLYQGVEIDSFIVTGDSLKIPMHIAEQIFPSSEFELKL